MKIKKLFPEKKIDNLAELKLSVLIHLAILLALTALFAWRQVNAEPIHKNIVPIKLIAPASTQKKSAEKNKTKKKTKSKKRKSHKKIIAKNKKAIRKKHIKQAKKSIQKKTKKITKKPIKRTRTLVKSHTKKNKGIKKLPTIIKTKITNKMSSKPTHNNPTFESIDYLSIERTAPSMIENDLQVELTSNSAITNDMPVFSPTDISDKERDKLMPKLSAERVLQDKNNNDEGFQIGSIESFSGTSEHFVPPSIISKKMPDYPKWARKKGVRGQATYRVLIQESGTVGDVVTMNSTIDPRLAINGAQALRRWMFTPVLENGEPKETWVKITVKYSLN